MEKILKYTIIIASVALLATACNLNDFPTFDDNDAFIALDNTTLSVNEDVGSVKISVTLASTAGLTSTATYTVGSDDDSAILGVDYSLVDESRTLYFDADNRTTSIEINIVDFAGDFTDDKKFTVNLTDTGSVNAGSSTSCVVTIVDLDHPLSSLFGTYDTNPYSYWYGSSSSWSVTISKDDTDTSVVWFEELTGCYIDTFYGTVNEDLTEIYVPLGQTSDVYNGDYAGKLMGCLEGVDYDSEAEELFESSGNIVFTIDSSSGGIVLTATNMGPVLWVDDWGCSWDAILPPFVLTKND